MLVSSRNLTTGDNDVGAMGGPQLDLQDPLIQNPFISDSDGTEEMPADAGENQNNDSTDASNPLDESESPEEDLPEPETNLPDSVAANPLEDGSQPDPMSPAIENLLNDLPYLEETNEYTADEDGGSFSVDKAIEFDENGNGTFVVGSNEREPFDGSASIDTNATRTNTDTSITYNYTWRRYNSSAARSDNRGIVSETQALDANTRTQTAQLTRRESGTGSDYTETTSYTLTGPIITDTRTCEASYGVLTYKHTRVRVDGDIVLTTVSKAIDDQYWNVTKTKLDGSVVDEYLAQRLGNVFYCDMVGL